MRWMWRQNSSCSCAAQRPWFFEPAAAVQRQAPTTGMGSWPPSQQSHCCTREAMLQQRQQRQQRLPARWCGQKRCCLGWRLLRLRLMRPGASARQQARCGGEMRANQQPTINRRFAACPSAAKCKHCAASHQTCQPYSVPLLCSIHPHWALHHPCGCCADGRAVCRAPPSACCQPRPGAPDHGRPPAALLA